MVSPIEQPNPFAAFATGFLQTFGEGIARRQRKAEDYEDQLRELADRNKSKLDLMQKAVKENEALVLRARNLFASDAQISMALDSGPNGLRDMVQRLNEAKNDSGWVGQNYSAELVQNMFKVPEDITVNVSVADRFGLGGMTAGDVEAPSSSWWGRGFGKDASARVRAELDQEMVAGTGVSVFDLSGLTDANLYNSLDPSSFLSFTAPNAMDDARTRQTQMEYLDMFKTVSGIANDRAKVLLDAALFEEQDGRLNQFQYQARLQEIENARKEEVKAALQAHFGQYVNQAMGFNDVMVPYLKAMGAQNPDHLLGVEVLEGGVNPEADTTGAGDDGNVVADDTGVDTTGVEAPELRTTLDGGTSAEAEGDLFKYNPEPYTYTIPLTASGFNRETGEEMTFNYRLDPRTGIVTDPTTPGTAIDDRGVLGFVNRGYTFTLPDGTVYSGGGLQDVSAEGELEGISARIETLVDEIVALEELPAASIGRRERESRLAQARQTLEDLMEREDELEEIIAQANEAVTPGDM